MRRRALPRSTRPPRVPAADGDPARPSARDTHWQAVQRSAGNAAAGSLLRVQRDGDAPPDFHPGTVTLGAGPTPSEAEADEQAAEDPPGPAATPSPWLSYRAFLQGRTSLYFADRCPDDPEGVEAAVRSRVTAWLDRARLALMMESFDGRMSLPELVALIRQHCEEGTQPEKVPPLDVRGLLQGFGTVLVSPVWIRKELVDRHQVADQLPERRMPTERAPTPGDVLAEMRAVIANLTMGRVKLEGGPGSLDLRVYGTVKARAKTGPLSGEVTADVPKGPKGISGKVTFHGVELNLSATSVGLGRSFAIGPGASVKLQGKAGFDGTWNVGLQFEMGKGTTLAARSTAEATGKALREMTEAVAEAFGQLDAEGRPSEQTLDELAKKIAEASENIQKAASTRPGKGYKVRIGGGVGQAEPQGPLAPTVRIELAF